MRGSGDQPRGTRLGEALLARRGGRSRQEVAREIGISEAALRRVEGGAKPSLEGALRLARWLGWTMERVVEAAGAPPSDERASGRGREGEWSVTLPVVPGMQEHLVYREYVEPHIQGVRPNIRQIIEYGFQEMMNNVIDHSGAREVRIWLQRTPELLTLVVADDGEGIFQKVQRAFHLPDIHETIFELTKGKLTTDPARHSGQGLFYTCRMFDFFWVVSGESSFATTAGGELVVSECERPARGTFVTMKLSLDSPRTTAQVFDAYASPEDYSFARTHLTVNLLRHGQEALVSRSQARRVIARLEQFEHVVLDFTGVDEIGQAFADEIFRVFADRHPEVQLEPRNTTEAVRRMISRALADRGLASRA